MSAGIDLALALVEKDFPAVEMFEEDLPPVVVDHRRAGGQSQHSTLLDLDATSDRVQTALAYAKGNLSKHLSTGDLAARAFLSPRQFSRHTFSEPRPDRTPDKAIEELLASNPPRLMMDYGPFLG